MFCLFDFDIFWILNFSYFRHHFLSVSFFSWTQTILFDNKKYCIYVCDQFDNFRESSNFKCFNIFYKFSVSNFGSDFSLIWILEARSRYHFISRSLHLCFPFILKNVKEKKRKHIFQCSCKKQPKKIFSQKMCIFRIANNYSDGDQKSYLLTPKLIWTDSLILRWV